MENGEPGTRNLTKLCFSVLFRKISNCCQSIIPSNINSGTFSVSAEVRQNKDSRPKKP